jgi:hypothetical protein
MLALNCDVKLKERAVILCFRRVSQIQALPWAHIPTQSLKFLAARLQAMCLVVKLSKADATVAVTPSMKSND